MTYRTQRRNLSRTFGPNIIRDALKVENERRKHFSIVLLPQPDTLDIRGHPTGLDILYGLERALYRLGSLVSCCCQFLLERGGWSIVLTGEQLAVLGLGSRLLILGSRVRIAMVKQLLLQRRFLTVATFRQGIAGVCTLRSQEGSASGGIGDIGNVGKGSASRHRGRDRDGRLGKNGDKHCCHV